MGGHFKDFTSNITKAAQVNAYLYSIIKRLLETFAVYNLLASNRSFSIAKTAIYVASYGG